MIHYNDGIISAMASQITSLTIVYSRRRSKKTSKLSVTGLFWGIHRWPMNCPHKGPVTRKMFPFDDVIMIRTSRSPGYFCDGDGIHWLPLPLWSHISWHLQSQRTDTIIEITRRTGCSDHDDVIKWKHFPSLETIYGKASGMLKKYSGCLAIYGF